MNTPPCTFTNKVVKRWWHRFLPHSLDPTISNFTWLHSKVRFIFARYRLLLKSREPYYWVPIHMPVRMLDSVELCYGPCRVLRGTTLEAHDGYFIPAKQLYIFPVSEESGWGLYVMTFGAENIEHLWRRFISFKVELRHEI